MMRGVLIDTSAIVALLAPSDANHALCTRQLDEIDFPMLTCWPVFTEAAWLLRARPDAVTTMLQGCGTRLLSLLTLDAATVSFILEFLARYQSLRPDLADACLVYLAEREGIDTIFTLDRRDFSVYRLKGRRPFKIIP